MIRLAVWEVESSQGFACSVCLQSVVDELDAEDVGQVEYADAWASRLAAGDV